jgi:hypothetical protein
MHHLLEKLQDQNISVGQGKHGDTCLDEEKSWCTHHTDTRCTQHNLHIKYIIISTYNHKNKHKKKHACKCVLNTSRTLSMFSGCYYMHDDMSKVLELTYKIQNINNTQIEQ